MFCNRVDEIFFSCRHDKSESFDFDGSVVLRSFPEFAGHILVEDGKIKVPTGPGIGVDIDPDYVKKHSVVKDV